MRRVLKKVYIRQNGKLLEFNAEGFAKVADLLRQMTEGSQTKTVWDIIRDEDKK